MLRQTPCSLATIVDHHADTRPEVTAVTTDRRSDTWRELARRSRALAEDLANRGVTPGDRVTLLADNRLETFALFAACTRIGAIFCPLNNRLAPAEVDTIVDQLEPALRLEGDDLDGLATNPRAGAPTPADDLDTPALILHTSGTTGRPKGALFTHRQLWWNWHLFADALDITSEDRNLSVAPLFHAAGLNVATMPTLLAGGTSHVRASFDPTDVARLIGDDRMTTAFMVPTMWQAVADALERDAISSTAFRVGVTGGAPTAPETFRRLADRGVALVEGYGMTEAGPMVSMLDADDFDEHATSVGTTPAAVETKVVDPETDQTCDPGELGELWVRGPNLAAGYWRGDDAAFVDGWFQTGDLVRIDEAGAISLVGRRDHRIITGGENVHPGEIEPLLEDVDGVEAVCVLGTPHERWGEAVTAVVVPEEGARPTLSQLRRACRGEVGRYKWPIRMVRADALPRNPTGKIDRAPLTERITDGDLAISQEYHAERITRPRPPALVDARPRHHRGPSRHRAE